jgi:hypothetical protein
MRRFWVASALAAACLPVIAAHGKLTRGAIAAVEKSLDRRLERDVLEDNLFSLTGMTRGLYLEGYGTVFSAEVDLVPTSITPFRPELTKEEVARVRQRKLERLPVLRKTMRDMMVASAGSLDGMPMEEQIVLGVTLTNRTWEDVRGIPSQIVMQAERRALLEFQTQRKDRALLETVIRTQEF